MGREGKPPAWPLSRQVAGEQAVWAAAWSTPQSVAWASLGWTRTVARYVRVLVASEEVGAKATLLAEVRQLEDRLGLTPMAMRRLLWEIEEIAPADDGTTSNVIDVDRWRRRGA